MPLADLVPTLARLATQGEALDGAFRHASPEGREPEREDIPTAQRAAWLRVLLSFEKAETLEGCFMEPAMQAIAASGLDHVDVTRFFRSQASDEQRHLEMLQAYVRVHYGEQPIKTSLLTGLLYDHVFGWMGRGAMKQPLLLLVPIYMLEKVGSLYLGRLARAAAEAGLPTLQSLLTDIQRDEARHTAGVGLTVRALVPAHPPSPRDRALLKAIARLIVIDMDRTAGWKRNLRAHMAALGLDAEGMNRDNEAVYREILDLLDGRALGEPPIEALDGDRHAAL